MIKIVTFQKRGFLIGKKMMILRIQLLARDMCLRAAGYGGNWTFQYKFMLQNMVKISQNNDYWSQKWFYTFFYKKLHFRGQSLEFLNFFADFDQLFPPSPIDMLKRLVRPSTFSLRCWFWEKVNIFKIAKKFGQFETLELRNRVSYKK